MWANWWGLRNSTLPEGVFNELVNAATSADRLQGNFAPLSANSLEMFLLLWELIKDMAAEPVISVTPSGCVVAEWYEDDENSLAILAGEGQDLHYSLFENGAIVEGSTPRDQLPDFTAEMRNRQQNPLTRSDAY